MDTTKVHRAESIGASVQISYHLIRYSVIQKRPVVKITAPDLNQQMVSRTFWTPTATLAFRWDFKAASSLLTVEVFLVSKVPMEESTFL